MRFVRSRLTLTSRPYACPSARGTAPVGRLPGTLMLSGSVMLKKASRNSPTLAVISAGRSTSIAALVWNARWRPPVITGDRPGPGRKKLGGCDASP